MNNLKLAYGSPGAKARIKMLKGLEEELSVQLLDRSDNGIWQRDKEAANRMSNQYRAYRNERLALSTAPLPSKPAQLPARNYTEAQVASLAAGPLDGQLYKPGDTVVVHSRGVYREALVVEGRRSNVEVAYTTRTAMEEAVKYNHPATPTVTRKVVATKHLLVLAPLQAAAPATTDLQLHDQQGSINATTNTEGGRMADEQNGSTEGKQRGGRKRLEPFADPQKIMADNKAAYDAFNKAHTDGDTAGKEANRAGFTLYRRAYTQDLATRRAKGELKRQPKPKEAAGATATAGAAQ